MSKAVKLVLCVIVGLALALLGLIGYMSFVNESANRAAVGLCREIRVGQSVSAVEARARASGARFAPLGQGNEYIFLFPGFGMDKAICEVQLQRGLVLSASAAMLYD